jgi:hypothetical protein
MIKINMNNILLNLLILCLALTTSFINNNQNGTLFTNGHPKDSCLIGEWLVYYEHAYDRKSGYIEPQKRMVTVFRDNGEYLHLSKKDTLTIGHWQLRGDSISLTYRTLIPRDNILKEVDYHIQKLNCDTLAVTFKTSFGTGIREYKKIKK